MIVRRLDDGRVCVVDWLRPGQCNSVRAWLLHASWLPGCVWAVRLLGVSVTVFGARTWRAIGEELASDDATKGGE